MENKIPLKQTTEIKVGDYFMVEKIKQLSCISWGRNIGYPVSTFHEDDMIMTALPYQVLNVTIVTVIEFY